MALCNMDDLLTQCPICLEDYTMPRALPCLHTFCEKCLLDWITFQQLEAGLRVANYGTFVCPVCKEKIKLPPQGVTGFKHNFYIASLVSKSAEYQQQIVMSECTPEPDVKLDTDIACQRCEEHGVSKICLKCAHWLCPLCCDDHSRVKSTKDHVLVTMEQITDASVPDNIKSNDISECPVREHGQNVCKFFCLSCKSLICEYCQLEYHSANAHQVLSVIPNIEHIRKHLLECLTSLQERSMILRSQHADLGRYRKVTNKRHHVAQKIIFKTVDMLQKRILDFKNHIYKELRKSLNSQASVFDHILSSITSKISAMDALQDMIKNMLETNSNKQILTQADELTARSFTHLNDEVTFDKLTVRYPKVTSVDKMKIDTLLYELIGTVSILSKDIDIGPVIHEEERQPSVDSSNSTDTTITSEPSPPERNNFSLPLILTRPCTIVEHLATPTDISTSEMYNTVAMIPNEQLVPTGPEIDPLSEGEEASASKLPLPSPKNHEQKESESQSTCDDDSDFTADESKACAVQDDISIIDNPKSVVDIIPSNISNLPSANDNPPSGPFYVTVSCSNAQANEKVDTLLSIAPPALTLSDGKTVICHSPTLMHKRRPPLSPPSPWKPTTFPRHHLVSSSARGATPVKETSTENLESRPPPSPPAKHVARKIKPFIKKWKSKQGSTSQ